MPGANKLHRTDYGYDQQDKRFHAEQVDDGDNPKDNLHDHAVYIVDSVIQYDIDVCGKF